MKDFNSKLSIFWYGLNKIKSTCLIKQTRFNLNKPIYLEFWG